VGSLLDVTEVRAIGVPTRLEASDGDLPEHTRDLPVRQDALGPRFDEPGEVSDTPDDVLRHLGLEGAVAYEHDDTSCLVRTKTEEPLHRPEVVTILSNGIESLT